MVRRILELLASAQGLTKSKSGAGRRNRMIPHEGFSVLHASLTLIAFLNDMKKLYVVLGNQLATNSQLISYVKFWLLSVFKVFENLWKFVDFEPFMSARTKLLCCRHTKTGLHHGNDPCAQPAQVNTVDAAIFMPSHWCKHNSTRIFLRNKT